MKQEEKEIRELFQQLRRDDESGAPLFVNCLAQPTSEHRGGARFSWQVAVAIVLTLVIGGVWLIYITRAAKTPVQSNVMNSGSASPRPGEAPAPAPIRPSIEGGRIKLPREHRKQTRVHPRPETLLLSQWRSPTEYLMRPPAGQTLRGIPRLNESLIEIRSIGPIQQ